MVMYPERLLREMKRVAKRQIISFPNFAFWKNRIDLLLQGRMPHHVLFGYPWYATGHIHQLSIHDFKNLVNTVGGLKIVEQQYADDLSPLKNMIADSFPNLFHLIPIYLIEKEST
jgi:methionine biosynthesis protein MetW